MPPTSWRKPVHLPRCWNFSPVLTSTASKNTSVTSNSSTLSPTRVGELAIEYSLWLFAGHASMKTLMGTLMLSNRSNRSATLVDTLVNFSLNYSKLPAYFLASACYAGSLINGMNDCRTFCVNWACRSGYYATRSHADIASLHTGRLAASLLSTVTFI